MNPKTNIDDQQTTRYVAGWLNSSVHDFVKALPHRSKAITVALVTCLDSNLEPATLLKSNSYFGLNERDVRILGGGFLIPAKVLRKNELLDKLFCGFDEIWFFQGERVSPKPESAWIVGPQRIDQTTFENLNEWMVSSNCSLGLGDGDGVNFIVKASGLVRSILAHTALQPPYDYTVDPSWVQDEEKTQHFEARSDRDERQS